MKNRLLDCFGGEKKPFDLEFCRENMLWSESSLLPAVLFKSSSTRRSCRSQRWRRLPEAPLTRRTSRCQTETWPTNSRSSGSSGSVRLVRDQPTPVEGVYFLKIFAAGVVVAGGQSWGGQIWPINFQIPLMLNWSSANCSKRRQFLGKRKLETFKWHKSGSDKPLNANQACKILQRLVSYLSVSGK